MSRKTDAAQFNALVSVVDDAAVVALCKIEACRIL